MVLLSVLSHQVQIFVLKEEMQWECGSGREAVGSEGLELWNKMSMDAEGSSFGVHTLLRASRREREAGGQGAKPV